MGLELSVYTWNITKINTINLSIISKSFFPPFLLP